MALVPVAATLAGAVALLEIGYRLSTQPESGTRIAFFGRSLDAATPWPWLAAALLLAGGGFALRRTRRSVAAAWQRASEAAGAGATP